MDEVDKITIHTLKKIGCKISDDVLSLREFSADMVVEACSKGLKMINDNLHLPESLPASMSARFRVGTSLAEAFKGIGYQGEIGYQSFLYCNEHELRRILMFIIEKLPKETSEAVDEPMGTAVLLNRRIANELRRQLSRSWTPSYCHQTAGMTTGFDVRTTYLAAPHSLRNPKDKYSPGYKDYYENHLSVVSNQPPAARDVTMSVLEMNASRSLAASEWENEWHHSGMSSRLSQEEYKQQKKARLLKKIKQQLVSATQKADSQTNKMTLNEVLESMRGSGNDKPANSKGSRFTHAEKLQFAKDEEVIVPIATEPASSAEHVDTEEDKQKKKEQEIETLQQQLSDLSQRLTDTLEETKQTRAQISQVVEEEAETAGKNKDEEMAYRLKKKAIELLPDAAENIKKLEDVVDSSCQRLVNLATQWEKRRKPMIDDIRKLKDETDTREIELAVMINKIKQLRIKMKDLADETKGKDELNKQLVAEYQQMAKDVNRSAYTKRILEIVANIKRQKEDIQKVLLDTRNLQKAINFLSGKLDRTFTEADELLFKDAKKDDFSRKAYKLLASVHENFGALVQMVEDTGSIMREIRDIEDQIDSINQEEANENLQSITKDLKAMKDENSTLMKQLKGLKN